MQRCAGTFHLRFMPRGLRVVSLFLGILSSATVFAQSDTVKVASDNPPREGNLNAAVRAAVVSGTLSSTVFKLEPNGHYVLTGAITVPAGEHLTVIAPEPGRTRETAPPQILWSSDTRVSTAVNFDCHGDITLRNVWLLYANTRGEQVGSRLQIQDDPEADSSGKGEIGVFDGVIFDLSGCPANGSGAVCVTAGHFKGSFQNCYFKNCVDRHYRYYGRAVSFPFDSYGWHIDSLRFENCTFANMGYGYMQEGSRCLGEGNYTDYVLFSHCTFLNVVMYPLESGYWRELSVTNSIFVNTHMYGTIPAYAEYPDDPYGGTLRIDSVSTFGFPVPFTEQDRRILFTNSSYFIEKWLRDWMQNNPASRYNREQGESSQIPRPQPMLSPGARRFFDEAQNGRKAFPFMNRADLYDSTDPGFIHPPTDTTGIKDFLYHKWWDSRDTLWAWKPWNSMNALWPLEENLAYENETLKKAGLGGFPLGDLYHWFPADYARWENQKNAENARIAHWLHTGRDTVFTGVNEQPPDILSSGFTLSQNYPNPFNPTTRIRYAVPRSGFMSLKLYNVRGREVATLFEGVRQAGKYTVTFDGSGLPGGIYLCRLGAAGFECTRKLTVLK